MNEIGTIMRGEDGVANLLDLVINCKINLIHNPSGGVFTAMGLAKNKKHLVYVYFYLGDKGDSTAFVDVRFASVVRGKSIHPNRRFDISIKDYAVIVSVLEFKRKALSY